MFTKPKRSDKQSRFDAFPYIDYSVGRGGGAGFTMFLFMLIFSIPYITGKFIIRYHSEESRNLPIYAVFLELGAAQRVRLEIQAASSGKVFVNTWKPTISWVAALDNCHNIDMQNNTSELEGPTRR
jgi:hypothetical protein